MIFLPISEHLDLQVGLIYIDLATLPLFRSPKYQDGQGLPQVENEDELASEAKFLTHRSIPAADYISAAARSIKRLARV